MLTQSLEPGDCQEHHTIYPINEKRVNETASALYQMKKIRDVPLDIEKT